MFDFDKDAEQPSNPFSKLVCRYGHTEQVAGCDDCPYVHGPHSAKGRALTAAAQATMEQITATAMQRATGAAFDPVGTRVLTKRETIQACAAVTTFLAAVEGHPGSVRDWRERIDALWIDLGTGEG